MGADRTRLKRSFSTPLPSRLALDHYLMLGVMAELHCEGVRVISVADGLDSEDEEATLGIQTRGIGGELQLRDLEKKTLRGQRGQKERGFSVGERTFGFDSVPVGTIQMDKKGRPRPADGAETAIDEARVRVGGPGGRGAAHRAPGAVGAGSIPAPGGAPELAG